MSYHYYAITDIIGGKRHSYVARIPDSLELISALNKKMMYRDDDGNSYAVTDHCAMIMPTRKKALDTVHAWNETALKDGKAFYSWCCKYERVTNY